MGGLFGGSTPSPPPPPPPAPTTSDADIQAAAAADRARRAAAQGRASTLLTGGTGDTSATPGAKVLLGT